MSIEPTPEGDVSPIEKLIRENSPVTGGDLYIEIPECIPKFCKCSNIIRDTLPNRCDGGAIRQGRIRQSELAARVLAVLQQVQNGLLV